MSITTNKLYLDELFYPKLTLLSGCLSSAGVALSGASSVISPLAGGMIGASTVTAFFIIRYGLTYCVEKCKSSEAAMKYANLVNVISGIAAGIIGLGIIKSVVGAASFKVALVVMGSSTLAIGAGLAVTVALIFTAFSIVGSTRKP